ncbi:hypothetical protein [Lactiplantibacillus songbeiensis]|uniref:Uncharacterized protein n=1 Tax=Lactiplantibacillus songbeiensis TaxID=2559920 RepID=A0ABW4C5B5_9LACO|nr:hypothetical protein [Lactiplantibacillus songbeiensis]
MFFKPKETPSILKTDIVKSVKSLDYFEAINFLAVVNKANNPKLTNRECYSEATAVYSDDEQLSFLISQAFKTGLH